VGSVAFSKTNTGDYENGDYIAATIALLVVLVAPLQAPAKSFQGQSFI
jgi:hypothetical protein